jgi:hypothetical protein
VCCLPVRTRSSPKLYPSKSCPDEASTESALDLQYSRITAGKAKAKATPRKTQATTARTSASSNASSNADVIAEKTRQTPTHVFFWAGPLSNWYKGHTYSGIRALRLTISQLDEITVSHPAESVLSSRLLAAHAFNCGEQWLMAMKGWLFERDVLLLEKTITDEQFNTVSAQLLVPRPPPKEQPLL